MKKHTLKKSSFTLPPDEVVRVKKLRKRLGLRSNTAVVRKALDELENQVDRALLREQFKQASQLTQKANQEEIKEFDLLTGEGLE